ncbi:MAG: type II secretion system F family protein [Candidatus Omnitrophica bacterium]|nr:type II secretion system F family protein [Candidatus Omnitrophota bacterium]MBU2044396.1 type II secretion system F family protein [Candidatus Omnitrophota bacterium]MBU2266436.1 type II secretion system F family protein [Candidatus Omnitrophota bacterium]MBU2473764.1 type II secretion system F family protein [Candidatus Omnitrophota bacterium]
MPAYKYTVRDRFGRKVKGFSIAADRRVLAEELAKMGYIFISADEVGRLKQGKTIKIKKGEVLNLTRNLSALLNGGIPLLESLTALIGDTSELNLLSILISIKSYVEAGGSFRDALVLHPKVFSELYRAVVAGGEATGRLGAALEQMSDYLEWEQDLQSRVQGLAIYPIILSVIMLLALGVIVIVVLPKFEALFSDFGAELPLITQLAMSMSKIVAKTWVYILGAIISAVIVLKLIIKRNYRLALFFDKYKLKLPIFGDVIYKLCVSHFARSTYLCLFNGIPIVTTLDMVRQTVGNKYLEAALDMVKKSVFTGGELSMALSGTNAFPSFMVRMVHVGESAGNLADGFSKTCKFYDKEIPRLIGAVFSILEPLIIVFLGVAVMGLAFVVFLPLTQLLQKVG